MGNRWDTGRTEAFSDGVFAIAITLLILDVAVPESEFDHLWRGIVHQWPAYLGYATSFITIGGIWLVHHGIFRRLQYANDRVMQINLLLLMAVSFLPFPTKLMAGAIRDSTPSGSRSSSRSEMSPSSPRGLIEGAPIALASSPASAGETKYARQDSNLRPLAPEGHLGG